MSRPGRPSTGISVQPSEPAQKAAGRTAPRRNSGSSLPQSGAESREMKPRNPERRKTSNPESLSAWTLSFILEIVVIDLEPVLLESQEDLVPDRDAGFGIAMPKLLHHVFRRLGGQGNLG
jgi:hypothetical protein